MLFSFLSLVGLAIACSNNELHARDGHGHAHQRRDKPQFAPTLPYRNLQWGDFNVIHTTDSHGWLFGHPKPVWPEPNYSGNLGDFASFVTHMKKMASDKKVDLLLVDSGDLHDGTGLSDGYPSNETDGQRSNELIKLLPYDLMTIGNHELYDYNVTYNVHTNFANNPKWNGRYLTSNANITIFYSNGTSETLPVGNRNVTFTTSRGQKVTSLGILFNFTGNATHTSVQLPTQMVNETWFKEAITEKPDVFVLVGHMPISPFLPDSKQNDWPAVFDAIRKLHNDTPILAFGGHSHIRDCRQPEHDRRTVALESGRFMETIGWMSVELDAAKRNLTEDLNFTRRYLDQNRVTYEFHTKKSGKDFETEVGLEITSGLNKLAEDFNLSTVYGTKVPLDYTFDSNPYGPPNGTSNGNIFWLFIKEVVPYALSVNNPRKNISNFIISNNGALRYSVFHGEFTKNDSLTASPYSDTFQYIPNVKTSLAQCVFLNLSGTKCPQTEMGLLARGDVESRYHTRSQVMDEIQVALMDDPTDLTPGYVTEDGCGNHGDDTLHTSLRQYTNPHYMSSDLPASEGDDLIDLVFLEHINHHDAVLNILNGLLEPNETKYTKANVSTYSNTTTKDMLGLYAERYWN